MISANRLFFSMLMGLVKQKCEFRVFVFSNFMG